MVALLGNSPVHNFCSIARRSMSSTISICARLMSERDRRLQLFCEFYDRLTVQDDAARP